MAGSAFPRRAATLEELLDLEEARAQLGLELRVVELRQRLGRGLDANEFIRRHPWWSVGLAGTAGLLAGPSLAAVLRAPSRMLRAVGHVVRPFGRAARGLIVGATALTIRTALRTTLQTADRP